MNKIFSWEEAEETVQQWKDMGQEVVFTNGCFDILHAGHIAYLWEANELGDKLVIGLNSDKSVKKLKGKNRPIQKEDDRAEILAALEMVDAVVVFNENTPEKLIKLLLPDVLVKGGDYKVKDIAGAKQVLENGGLVEVLSFVKGKSTSAIEQKIRKS